MHITPLHEAWVRYEAHRARVRPTLYRIDLMTDRAFDIATGALFVIATTCSVAVVVLFGEIITGSSWRPIYIPLMMCGAWAALALLTPAALGVAAAVLNVRSSVILRRESRRATREVAAARTLPLADVLWAVRQVNSTPLPRRGMPHEHLVMAARVARKVAARYGSDTRKGGKLYDLDTLSPRAVDRFAYGWDGSTEAFLAKVRPLNQNTWRTALSVVELARDANYAERWVNEYVDTITEAQLSDFQTEAMRLLARDWEGGPEELVRTAAQL